MNRLTFTRFENEIEDLVSFMTQSSWDFTLVLNHHGQKLSKTIMMACMTRIKRSSGLNSNRKKSD